MQVFAGCDRLEFVNRVEDGHLVPISTRTTLRPCTAGSRAQDAWLRAFFEGAPA